MAWDEEEDTTIYNVVINHEEQYSIWPVDRENAPGWKSVGKSGTKQECLDYIDEVWTDMRPLSLRRQMEEQARLQPPVSQPETAPAMTVAEGAGTTGMDPLVQRLSEGDHPVAIRRAQDEAAVLQRSIERGFMHITFTETQGGTELGVRLDTEATDLSQADFNQSTGSAYLVGNLTLNYIPLRCVASIDLNTLKGMGHLEPLPE